MDNLDHDLINFLNGDANVIKREVIISRETTSKGMQYIHVTTLDDKLNYNFWHNPENAKKEVKPKSMGGKKPYLMLMVEHLDGLKAKGVERVEEMVGFLVCLGRNIEWGTGRLIGVRNKKPLKYADLQKIFSGNDRSLNRVIKALRDNNLLTSNQEGYFISSELIKKGSKR